MTLNSVLYAIGGTGIFPSRAFMPAFLTALAFRYVESIPLVSQSRLLENVTDVPVWFTHDATLWVLGILSVAECLIAKNSEIRDWLQDFDRPIKSLISFFVFYGVLSSAEATNIENAIEMDLVGSTLALGCASGVYFLCELRQSLYTLVNDIDPDDVLRIRRTIAWFEDAWVLGALILLFLAPLLMILLSTSLLLALERFRRRIARRADEKMVACKSCGTRIPPCAISCHTCSRKLEQPCAIGFLGQIKPTTAASLKEHPFRLLENARCPECASRLRSHDQCGACGLRVFGDPSVTDAYGQFIDGRIRNVALVCIVLGLVPIAGAVAAIIYYRISVVAPYQRHLGATSRISARWKMRIVNFGLLAFQWLPPLGGVTVPLMAVMSHRTYRSAFRAKFRKKPTESIPAAISSAPNELCLDSRAANK